MSKNTYEKLLTLAKQDYIQRVKALNITEMDEILYRTRDYEEMTRYGRQIYIAKKIYRPIIKKYGEDPEKYLEYIQGTCGPEWNIQIETAPENSELIVELVGPKKALGDLLKVTFQLTESTVGTVYGFTENKIADLNIIGSIHRDINVVDLGYFFAGIYLYNEMRQELLRIKALSPEERVEDEHYKHVLAYFTDYHKRWDVDYEADKEAMLTFCRETMDSVLIWRDGSAKKDKLPYNKYKVLRHKISMMAEHRFYYYMFQLMMSGDWPMLSYLDTVNFSLEERIGGQVNTAFSPFNFLEVLQDDMVEKRKILLANYNIYKEMDSEYSRSFMTKKNRSLKLQEQTEMSVLWKYFGYVEYDEDVDIEAIRQYEEEFETFYQKNLKGLDLSENAVRFRRLGQHHAAGLYYPHVKCLCVDIRNPYSMVHELGHLIDYLLGNLSVQKEFHGVYKAAKEYLTGLAREKDALGRKLSGKTKYNLAYYLTPTEIFARSFELYAYYEWKEESSLLDDEYSGVYDTSEEFLLIVKEYFEGLFVKLLK